MRLLVDMVVYRSWLGKAILLVWLVIATGETVSISATTDIGEVFVPS